jgi:hypothetical protein
MVQCYTEYELSATVFGAVIVSFLNTIWSMEVLASAFVGPVTTISSLSSARTSFVLSCANATVRENPSPLHFDKVFGQDDGRREGALVREMHVQRW